MADTAVADLLRRVTLFRDLPPSVVQDLAHQVVRRRYGRNELIFAQGDRGDGLCILMEGHVSISRQNLEGDELILAVYEPGEYFGELALFDNEPRSANATSIDDTVLLHLSQQGFRSFIEAHPGAVFSCLQVIVRQMRRLTDLADEIALLDIRRRLARRLVRLAEQHAFATDEERSIAMFRITQQQLASMLGATRESVNKHLNQFVDEGLIRLERGKIRILDLKRLEETAEA